MVNDLLLPHPKRAVRAAAGGKYLARTLCDRVTTFRTCTCSTHLQSRTGDLKAISWRAHGTGPDWRRGDLALCCQKELGTTVAGFGTEGVMHY